VKKELRPVHDVVTCDVCGRTILKGERAEAYLAPGGQRRQVCDLCSVRAQHEGWIRESAAGDMPTRMPRSEPRRGVLGRLRRRPPDPPSPPAPAPPRHTNGAEHVEQEEVRPPPPRPRPKDPRHVRAVPTTAQAKVDRALELFNGSSHQRTVAGLARTLGTPFVSAQPDTAQGSQVTVVVAWELSWYRFRVDLGDAADPVTRVENGEELDQIDENLREWNATVDADGRLVEGHAVAGGGTGER
jgi:hypothetical protein